MTHTFRRQAFLASALGAAGGIGGGGILVPLLTSVGGFSIHRAIPLTQVCVFGASIMNFVLVRSLPIHKCNHFYIRAYTVNLKATRQTIALIAGCRPFDLAIVAPMSSTAGSCWGGHQHGWLQAK